VNIQTKTASGWRAERGGTFENVSIASYSSVAEHPQIIEIDLALEVSRATIKQARQYGAASLAVAGQAHWRKVAADARAQLRSLERQRTVLVARLAVAKADAAMRAAWQSTSPDEWCAWEDHFNSLMRAESALEHILRTPA
jgi:hypothetical protein